MTGIFFPNTVYGAWEDSLAPGYSRMTPQEKHERRLAALGATRFHAITDKDYAQHLTLASVWTHTSADFTALCYQAYNRAEQLINRMPAGSYNNPAIIADIDGTVLDFTTIRANLTDANDKMPVRFDHNWFLTEHQHSRPIPGAAEFLNSASQKGYEIFYVSSRPLSKIPDSEDTDVESATIKKLTDYHFPYADRQHVLLREEHCSTRHKKHCGKELKRAAIQNGDIDNKKHDIVLMIGDLLSDFSLTEQQLDPRLKESAATAASQFGNNYIILPNPLNTVWMWQLYSREAQKQNQELTQMSWKEQAELRRSLLLDWPEKWSHDRHSN
ncbi:HAD family acid phosphatase [Endozoicomonas lisbonensis]|uniref:HAD family acid phosphatase n=1 Tax=Endozoicomonas lisbonensis TaxID=3120522 RepID=UPI00339A52F3